MKVVVVVQARMGSSRLPGKVLTTVAGKPLLGYQIDRLRQLRHADEVLVATTVEPVDDVIAEYCASQGIGVVRGSQVDVLSRYMRAAEASAADVVVRLTGDCPLIDPALVDEVIAAYLAAPHRRYVSNTIERTYPRGMDIEVFSRAMLEEAHRDAVTRYDREHVTPFIRHALAGTDFIGNVSASPSLDAYRITVDYPSDYVIVKALIESDLPDYSLATLMRRASELHLDLHEAAWQRQEHGNMLDRFGLGAAQFGLHYGRFNGTGKPSQEMLAAILDQASEFGLTSVDTAHLYGDSEAVLGRCGKHLSPFEIVTKTPRFHDGTITAADAQELRAAFQKSQQELHLDPINGLLIHHAPNLLAPGGELLYEVMLQLKREGHVERIGVSVYNGETAEKIQAKFPMDIVQMPMNVLDQRALASGALARLAAAGVRVQVRSVFLQGLLLNHPESLDSQFDPAKPALRQFQASAHAAGMLPAHAALHFLLSIPQIDRVLVGVDSVQQLQQLFASFPLAPDIDYRRFAIDIPEILNPGMWLQ